MEKQEGLWRDAELDISELGCPLCSKRRTMQVMERTEHIFRCVTCGYIWPANNPVNYGMVADAQTEMIAARRELADCDLGDPALCERAEYWTTTRQAYAALVLAQGTPENYALTRMHDIVRHYQD